MPKPSLPLVDELCDRLGYAGSEPSRRQVDLTNSTKAWRVAYVSDDGTPGEDIRHWNPEMGNEDLKRMAEKFLEEGYGLKHWPSTSEGGLGLEFPRDKETLAELLHQLFFRQNNNAWKNRFVVGQKKPRESSGTAFSDSNFEENSKTTAPSKYDGAAKLSIGPNETQEDVSDSEGRRRSTRSQYVSGTLNEANLLYNLYSSESDAELPPLSRKRQESTNLNAVPRIPDMTGAIPGELKGDRSGDRQNSTNTGKVLARPKNVSGTRFQPANDETGFTPVSDLDPGVTNPTDEMGLRVIDPSGHSKKPMEDALFVDADDDLSRIRRRVSYDKWTSSDRQESSKQSSNLTAAETPGAPVNATHRRLSRKPLNACTLCKAAHKKCDRKAPCSYCVSIGGAECIYDEKSLVSITKRRSTKRPTSSDRGTPGSLSYSGDKGVQRQQRPQTLNRDKSRPFISDPKQSMQSSNIATGSTLPSRSPTIERDRGSGTPLDSTSKPKTYDIRYFIFANDIQERWTGKTLGESSLDSFFEEASIYARGSDTLRIRFVLGSYQSGFRNRADNIGRGEEVEFSEMKDEFWAALKEGKANGITKFKLLLEPVLANQGGPESSLKVEDDPEMQIW